MKVAVLGLGKVGHNMAALLAGTLSMVGMDRIHPGSGESGGGQSLWNHRIRRSGGQLQGPSHH